MGYFFSYRVVKGSAKKKTEGKQQSAQVNSKAPILGDSRATVPEQRQSESQSMLLNRSDQENENDHSVVGHQVIIRGRVVVFNDKGTLCSIPLHMQRDIYRQTVVLNYAFHLATHKGIGDGFEYNLSKPQGEKCKAIESDLCIVVLRAF